MSKRNIREMFHISDKKASEIYKLADALDDKELSYRLYPARVRTASVEAVCGLTTEQFAELVSDYAQKNTR